MCIPKLVNFAQRKELILLEFGLIVQIQTYEILLI